MLIIKFAKMRIKINGYGDSGWKYIEGSGDECDYVELFINGAKTGTKLVGAILSDPAKAKTLANTASNFAYPLSDEQIRLMLSERRAAIRDALSTTTSSEGCTHPVDMFQTTLVSPDTIPAEVANPSPSADDKFGDFFDETLSGFNLDHFIKKAVDGVQTPHNADRAAEDNSVFSDIPKNDWGLNDDGSKVYFYDNKGEVLFVLDSSLLDNPYLFKISAESKNKTITENQMHHLLIQRSKLKS